MIRHRLLPLVALILPLAAGVAFASIERLTLRQMVEKTDGAIFGEIVGRQVTAVPMDDGSGELFFTTLTVQGAALYGTGAAGKALTVSFSFPGGFVDRERGVWNSEAPSEDDVRVGNRIVAFYKWSENMGGGFAGNALYASHGGLFRTFETKQGARVVQGRGPGYAVPANRTLAEVEREAADFRRAFERR